MSDAKTIDNLKSFLTDLNQEMQNAPERGTVASYIPELANIDPNQFALSICFKDGEQINVGCSQTDFSIQSISKVFTLAIALGRIGHQLWERVGQEPSGNAFNSIVQLEAENGIPRNPFINAGAIITTDAILSGKTPRDALAELLHFVRTASGDDNIYINEIVAESEKKTGHRNYSLAHFMKSCGNINNDIDCTLGTYFHQCAIEMNAEQLARAGRFLCDGFNNQRLINIDHVHSINALMMTCGHYDGSGRFAHHVGFPGKSGVGGGILAIVPNIASIAVWSPGLDKYGNSQLGTLALERLSKFMDWSVFH